MQGPPPESRDDADEYSDADYDMDDDVAVWQPCRRARAADNEDDALIKRARVDDGEVEVLLRVWSELNCP